MRISGRVHIRWTSRNMRDFARQVRTISGPKEILGTKWPSIISRCSQSALLSCTRNTSNPILLKFAASSDGAIIIGQRLWICGVASTQGTRKVGIILDPSAGLKLRCVLNEIGGRLRAAAHLKLVENVAEVVLNCLVTQPHD